MSAKTSQQYQQIVELCTDLFNTKMKDYGSAWRVLRTSSLTDQIFIKAQRIRSIEEKKTQKIADDIRGEYIGIINYSVMALITMELGETSTEIHLDTEQAGDLYEKYIMQAKQLMEDKNHDYGEAWRDMRLSSLTDIILMKLFRIKQIEDNNGMTQISEGLDANFFDIVNYAVFAMIKIDNPSFVEE